VVRKNAAHNLDSILECMSSLSITRPSVSPTFCSLSIGEGEGGVIGAISVYHKDSEAMWRMKAQLVGTLAGFPESEQNPTGGVDLANLRKRWRQIWGQGLSSQEHSGQKGGGFSFEDLPDHRKVEGYGRRMKTLAELLSKWRDVVKVERRGPGKTWVTGLISQVQIIAACKRLTGSEPVT
jgi:hypothetical protein